MFILGEGSQPPEAAISVVCEAFGCTPKEALEQDWRVVKNILDYRAMVAAKEQHNVDVTKMTPGQVALWLEMIEAAKDG